MLQNFLQKERRTKIEAFYRLRLWGHYSIFFSRTHIKKVDETQLLRTQTTVDNCFVLTLVIWARDTFPFHAAATITTLIPRPLQSRTHSKPENSGLRIPGKRTISQLSQLWRALVRKKKKNRWPLSSNQQCRLSYALVVSPWPSWPGWVVVSQNCQSVYMVKISENMTRHGGWLTPTKKGDPSSQASFLFLM